MHNWDAASTASWISAAEAAGVLVSIFGERVMIVALPGADRGMERLLREHEADVAAEMARTRPTRTEARAWFAIQSAARTPM